MENNLVEICTKEYRVSYEKVELWLKGKDTAEGWQHTRRGLSPQPQTLPHPSVQGWYQLFVCSRSEKLDCRYDGSISKGKRRWREVASFG